MFVIAIIGHVDQTFVKPALICPAFISTDQQERLSLWVKSQCHASNLALPRKPQFFHVGVPRSPQSVDRRTAQIGAEFRQQASVRQDFVLQLLRQAAEFCIKGVVK